MAEITVGIILGSKSDLENAEPCKDIFSQFGISYELRICSAHRAPEDLVSMIKDMENRGCEVFIAMAGAAAHLPGVIASRTIKPVIGVPLPATPLQGTDALYSIVQMPGGIPVACMAIGKAGAKNAALLAAQILAVKDEKLRDQLLSHRDSMRIKVLSDDKNVNNSR